jgi:hypothetical protein
MSVFGAGRHKLAANRYDSQFSMPLSTLVSATPISDSNIRILLIV